MENSSGGMPHASLRPAMVRRLHRRAIASGSIALPAVPGMLDDYVSLCESTFAAIGVKFSPEQLLQLRRVLEGELAIAFRESPRSEIVITYESPLGLEVNYHVRARWFSLDAAYDQWVAQRQPPLFGSEPDAMVIAMAGEIPAAAQCPVLDVGAGTGRNALALARRGHPVDAVELSPKFVEVLTQQAAQESLPVRVVQSDVFAATQNLRRDYGLMVVSEVVSDFRVVEQLRQVFILAAQCLAPGGLLVFNAFVARDGYTPDAAAREFAQQCYSAILTRAEIAGAAVELPLRLERDEAVYEYEKANLPATGWPPTSWYEGWVSGQDVFDLPREAVPLALRWFVYRKGA
jgi:2-polyprenyl-3-methyl-5-hydroxy-6-metoxy-1,4-benzoquinol methylase